MSAWSVWKGISQQDVDIGWGILGRLDNGGWIVIEQADVGGGDVANRAFQMAMTGRVFFKIAQFRYHRRRVALCARAVGLDVPAGHPDAALGRGRPGRQRTINPRFLVILFVLILSACQNSTNFGDFRRSFAGQTT